MAYNTVLEQVNVWMYECGLAWVWFVERTLESLSSTLCQRPPQMLHPCY